MMADFATVVAVFTGIVAKLGGECIVTGSSTIVDMNTDPVTVSKDRMNPTPTTASQELLCKREIGRDSLPISLLDHM